MNVFYLFTGLFTQSGHAQNKHAQIDPAQSEQSFYLFGCRTD